MWSDPEDIETWAVSPRGAGWFFLVQGSRLSSTINNPELVYRAHQLVQEGLKYTFQDNFYCPLFTFWDDIKFSSPNIFSTMKYFVVKIYDVVTNKLASFHIQLKFWTQIFVTKSNFVSQNHLWRQNYIHAQKNCAKR